MVFFRDEFRRDRFFRDDFRRRRFFPFFPFGFDFERRRRFEFDRRRRFFKAKDLNSVSMGSIP
jgi:hypothetical protein